MIIETERAMAMRCPACGKLNHQVFSLFAFSGSRTLKLECSCGFSIFQLSSRDRLRYSLQTFCVVCEMPHVYTLTARELWSEGYTSLNCSETGIELGYLGSKPAIQDIVRREQTPLEDLLTSQDHTDYFENREVMIGVLQSVQRLADEGRVFCQCGNANIDIDIFPERVELHCPQCDGALTVYGRTEDELERIDSINQIELATTSFSENERGRFKTRK